MLLEKKYNLNFFLNRHPSWQRWLLQQPHCRWPQPLAEHNGLRDVRHHRTTGMYHRPPCPHHGTRGTRRCTSRDVISCWSASLGPSARAVSRRSDRLFAPCSFVERSWLKVLFADLLWEKNTVECLADSVDKLKRLGCWTSWWTQHRVMEVELDAAELPLLRMPHTHTHDCLPCRRCNLWPQHWATYSNYFL
jgi:hypothetical protein